MNMSYLKRFATLSIVACMALPVSAEQTCDVDLSSGIFLNTDTLEFFKEADTGSTNTEQAKQIKSDNKQSLYKITSGKNLFINNKAFNLTDSQQELVTKFDKKIRELTPEVKALAITGIDSAIEGVNLAFNGLLGEGNQLATDLTKDLTEIKQQVIANMSIEKGVSIGTDGLEDNSILGENFEQKINTLIEKAMVNSMASIFMAIGQQMMTSGSQGESFDVKMEKFSNSIEKEMSARTAAIEKQSQALCRNAIELEQIEEQLKAAIQPLANINVFNVSQFETPEQRETTE